LHQQYNVANLQFDWAMASRHDMPVRLRVRKLHRQLRSWIGWVQQ
jgi:hypothetical protein